VLPSPGSYALVLDPIIISKKHSCRFSRVLIDGGSSINLLYRSSLERLGISESQLEPSSTSFHGAVPGPSHSPIGKIRLDVIFGSENNFRREPIWFEVVNLSSAYHAILGRPALTKFMGVPHYAYLKMKLPGPKGVITVDGCYKRSIECATDGSKLAEAMIIAEEKRVIMQNVAALQKDMPAGEPKPAGESQFKPSQGTRKILLNEEDPSKFVLVGDGLDNK
jgi:hypothetical protein